MKAFLVTAAAVVVGIYAAGFILPYIPGSKKA